MHLSNINQGAVESLTILIPLKMHSSNIDQGAVESLTILHSKPLENETNYHQALLGVLTLSLLGSFVLFNLVALMLVLFLKLKDFFFFTILSIIVPFLLSLVVNFLEAFDSIVLEQRIWTRDYLV